MADSEALDGLADLLEPRAASRANAAVEPAVTTPAPPKIAPAPAPAPAGIRRPIAPPIKAAPKVPPVSGASKLKVPPVPPPLPRAPAKNGAVAAKPAPPTTRPRADTPKVPFKPAASAPDWPKPTLDDPEATTMRPSSSAPSWPTPAADDPEATVMRPSSSAPTWSKPVADDPEATVMRPSSSDPEATTMRAASQTPTPRPAWQKKFADDPERTHLRAGLPQEVDDDPERTTLAQSGSIRLAQPANADAELTSMYKPDDSKPVVVTDNELTSMYTGETADEELTSMHGEPVSADDIATRLSAPPGLAAGASGSAKSPLKSKKQKRDRERLADEALPKGTVVGRYVVLERIGTGGMGSVYAAFDPELDRKVAVKLLHSMLTRGAAGPDARTRLLREAQAMAKLSHPAVVTVHDVGVFNDQVFMAMEFVEGKTLKEWVAEHKPGWREVLKVFAAAGHGLAAAHAAGLIHRDFKPTNVLISADNRVRVLDFGLARRTEYNSADDIDVSASQSQTGSGVSTSSSSGERRSWAEMIKNGEISLSLSASSLDMNLTQAGSIMGSPAYMSPEQHMSQRTDPRTDQFSFCVALYEALYGQRPFEVEDNRLLVYAILEKRIHKPPRDTNVPNWLRKVIVRGLSPNPEERYPTMDELLADLGRDPGRAARRWSLRMGAFVAVLAAGTGIAWPYINPPQMSEDATAYIDQLAASAHEAAAKAQFVYPPKNDPDALTAYKIIIELEKIDDETKTVALQRARELREEFAATLVTIGDRYWDQEGGQPFAIDYYAQALVFDESDGRARERAALTVGQLASLRRKADHADFSQQELAAAEPLAALAEQDEEQRKQKVETMLASAGERSVVAEAHLQQLLGSDEAKAKKKAAAAPKPKPTPAVPVPEPVADDPLALGSGLASGIGVGGGDKKKRDPKAANAVAEQGRAALRETRWKDAEKLFHQALGMDRNCAAALIGLSDLHFDQGEYGKAVTYAEKAVAASPRNGGYRIKLGDVYYKVVRYSDAKKSYEAAADLGHASAAARLEKLSKQMGG